MGLSKFFSSITSKRTGVNPANANPVQSNREVDYYGIGGADTHFTKEVRDQLAAEVIERATNKQAD